jgi:hypothetical protein
MIYRETCPPASAFVASCAAASMRPWELPSARMRSPRNSIARKRGRNLTLPSARSTSASPSMRAFAAACCRCPVPEHGGSKLSCHFSTSPGETISLLVVAWLLAAQRSGGLILARDIAFTIEREVAGLDARYPLHMNRPCGRHKERPIRVATRRWASNWATGA